MFYIDFHVRFLSYNFDNFLHWNKFYMEVDILGIFYIQRSYQYNTIPGNQIIWCISYLNSWELKTPQSGCSWDKQLGNSYKSGKFMYYNFSKYVKLIPHNIHQGTLTGIY